MIYSVGHSTLVLPAFLNLIDCLDVLMDIRSHPTSRHPQFRKEELEVSVPQLANVKYEWEPRLGGWTERHYHLQEQFAVHGVNISAYAKGKFPKQQIAAKRGTDELWTGKPVWDNQGLYDYSWFMTLPEFIAGAEDLMRRSEKENIGIMCCEVLPWKCHRSMVADYLITRGFDTVHLQPREKKHSAMLGNRLERYDMEIVEFWRSQRPQR